MNKRVLIAIAIALAVAWISFFYFTRDNDEDIIYAIDDPAKEIIVETSDGQPLIPDNKSE